MAYSTPASDRFGVDRFADTERLDPVPPKRNNAVLGLKLAAVAVVMVFLAPVMYRAGTLVCDWAGIGFNPDGDSSALIDGAGDGRTIEAIFGAKVNTAFGDQLAFTVRDATQEALVGDRRGGSNLFQVENVSDETLYIRPMHYVSPPQASRKFIMTECFCYNDMKLEPGESRELPLVYGFQADMDRRVNQAMINYTLEPITAADLREQISGEGDPFQRREAPEGGGATP